MELVLKGGDHAEVAAAAPDGPEEVLVLTGIDVAELAVGGDDVGSNEVVAGQAVPARQPADAAAQGEAGDAGVGVSAPRGGQAEGLSLVVEFPPLDAALGPHGALGGVNPDALHAGQVNHQAAVAHAVTRDVMAAAAHRHQ
jgi:hypothetical protein